MGLPKKLVLPEGKDYRSSGIDITYFKGRDALYIDGYYDTYVGIEGTEITFSEFCRRLGIDLERKR